MIERPAALRGASGTRRWRAALALGLWALLTGSPPASAQTASVGPSGLPLPRFASVKSHPVNIRIGPSRDHDIAWTFLRSSLPVEITQEFDVWVRVRDAEGQEGWVQRSFLSGKRTALVTPWNTAEPTVVWVRPDQPSLVARLSANVLVEVDRCDGRMCRVTVDKVSGWVDQGRLWGVYPNEKYPAD